MSQRVTRLAAVCAWIALAILFPSYGRGSPDAGLHAAAYVVAFGLAAFITRMGWQRVESRKQIVLFSLACAILQITRGGEAGMAGWAASTAGAVIGVVLARAITHER